MLELTGQREDVGGYYRQKFEMARKAWDVWKQYLEEKEERRRAGREKALRRKMMGYDEFNNNWRGPSWADKGACGHFVCMAHSVFALFRSHRFFRSPFPLLPPATGADGNSRGGPGWDRQGTAAATPDRWDFGGRRRGDDYDDDGDEADDAEGGGGRGRSRGDDELENKFLDQLMQDLDGPGAAKAAAARRSNDARSQQRQEATLADEEIDALMRSKPMRAPGQIAQSRRRRGLAGEDDEDGRGGSTLSDEEQKELDVWLGMISTGKGDAAAGASRGASPPSSSSAAAPVGMGGQSRAKPAGGRQQQQQQQKQQFALDPEEEQELNDWLSRFDADYAEGADGLSVSKKRQQQSPPVPKGACVHACMSAASSTVDSARESGHSFTAKGSNIVIHTLSPPIHRRRR